jgi:hypothetical protein
MVYDCGGGYFESALYEIAVEIGILIWHDLMFGCAQYPNHDWFLEEVKAEFESQIRRNRHHACIMIWAGDNEVFPAGPWNWHHSNYAKWLRREYKFYQVQSICEVTNGGIGFKSKVLAGLSVRWYFQLLWTMDDYTGRRYPLLGCLAWRTTF